MENIGSSNNSNLSNYNYDMIVATSQDAINATLKQYLYKMDTTEYIVAYSLTVDEKGHAVINKMDYNSMINTIGIDLFEISEESKTDKESEAIDKAYDEFDFYMAIKGSIGIDQLTNDLPDIMTLIESDISSQANAIYKAYFNDLEIINLREYKRKVYFTHLIQPKDNPWSFNFNVKLDLMSQEFKNLPEDIQKQIKNLDPSTMFSIQQLYLDLNSAKLQSCPIIEGIEEGTDEYDLLNKFFIETYWAGLKNGDADDVIFGYTILPSKDNLNYNPNYILVPTDFTFYISTYTNPKTKEKKPGLNTLNYVVMCDNHDIPKIKPFTWNWIEDEETTKKHGVISVNRNNFAQKVTNQLMNSLKELLLQPVVGVKKNRSNFHLEMDLNPYTGDINPIEITKNGEEVAKFYFTAKASDDDKYGLMRKGSASIEYKLEYSVKFIKNRIEIIAKINTPITVDPGAITKTAKGEIASYTLRDYYDLFVDENGRLIFKYSHEDEEKKGNFDAGIWTNMWFKNFDGFVQRFCNKLEKKINSYHSKYNDAMLTCLSKSLNWVFPGNCSFIYSNVEFSEYQDLIVDVTYVQEC